MLIGLYYINLLLIFRLDGVRTLGLFGGMEGKKGVGFCGGIWGLGRIWIGWIGWKLPCGSSLGLVGNWCCIVEQCASTSNNSHPAYET